MQSIFKRHEKKYLITLEQYAAFADILSRHMMPDRFCEYLVQNLYYDTENWDVIRASIEKPLFKEKLRLRCYGVQHQESELFLELKKQYKGVVYKRRIAVPMNARSGGTARVIVPGESSQISRELDFYMKTNAVNEKIYISFRRIAFAGIEDNGLRVTFDTDIRFRLDCLDFLYPDEGISILPHDKILMEVKTLGAMPLWMAHALCENEIYPVTFSKYGVCYTKYILKQAGTDTKKTKTERKVKISA